MAGWIPFYTVMAAASATLLGLLFVAVSIDAPGTLADLRSATRGLAEQAFQNYLLVLIVSGVLLFPAMKMGTIGVTVLCVTGSRGLWAVLRLGTLIGHARRGDALTALRRQAASLVGLVCLIVASLRLALALGDGAILLASGVLILLASSAVASWSLLLHLVHRRHGHA